MLVCIILARCMASLRHPSVLLQLFIWSLGCYRIHTTMQSILPKVSGKGQSLKGPPHNTTKLGFTIGLCRCILTSLLLLNATFISINRYSAISVYEHWAANIKGFLLKNHIDFVILIAGFRLRAVGVAVCFSCSETILVATNLLLQHQLKNECRPRKRTALAYRFW